jgi:hypothetical protein
VSAGSDNTGLRCALASAARGDSLVGTAPPAQTFMAVELAGPWAANAIRESRASTTALIETARRVSAAGGRLVVIRRPGRRSVTDRRWYWADCRPGRESLRSGSVGDDEEMASLRLDGTDGVPEAEPLWLCCTHGKHDRCCAEEGRVVFRDLEALEPGRVWESSHLGGCRFAGNVVVLPHGLYYGRMSTADVPAVVAAHRRGEVVLEHLRGRSAVSAPAQAAMQIVARRFGSAAIDAVAVGEPTESEVDVWAVPVRVDGVEMSAFIRLSGVGEPVRLTCNAQFRDRPPAWLLERLTRDKPADRSV